MLNRDCACSYTTYSLELQKIDKYSSIKGQPGALKAPAYAGSGKGSHHLVYCTQSYPVFTQEAVSRT